MKKLLRHTHYIFSLEIRVGNSTDHHENPLCNWLRGNDLSDVKQNDGRSNKFVSCFDESQVVGRYVSLISNDADIPLTLCQGTYCYIHQNENIIRK